MNIYLLKYNIVDYNKVDSFQLCNVPLSLSPMCTNWHHHKPAMWHKHLGGQLDPVCSSPQLQRQSSATSWKHQFGLLCQQSLKLQSTYSSVWMDV